MRCFSLGRGRNWTRFHTQAGLLTFQRLEAPYSDPAIPIMAKAITDTERAEIRSHLHAACDVLDRHPDLGLAEDLLIRASVYLSLPRGSDTEQCIADIIGGAPAEQIERKLCDIDARLAGAVS
jgi:hypothetical protein